MGEWQCVRLLSVSPINMASFGRAARVLVEVVVRNSVRYLLVAVLIVVRFSIVRVISVRLVFRTFGVSASPAGLYLQAEVNYFPFQVGRLFSRETSQEISSHWLSGTRQFSLKKV